MTEMRWKVWFVNVLWEFEGAKKGKMEFGLIKNLITEIQVLSTRFYRKNKTKITFQTHMSSMMKFKV